MKKLILCILLALCVANGALAEPAQRGGIVRMHVIGMTDLAEDQAYKLQVRDWALAYIRENFEGCGAVEEYMAQLAEFTDELAGHLNACAAAAGHEENISVQTGRFRFPRTEYEGIAWPEGIYDALRIVIGAGEGRNWWCVLYSGICGEDGADTVCYSAVVDWFIRLLGIE